MMNKEMEKLINELIKDKADMRNMLNEIIKDKNEINERFKHMEKENARLKEEFNRNIERIGNIIAENIKLIKFT
jgi:predicted nuclease with TOPRIM domain